MSLIDVTNLSFPSKNISDYGWYNGTGQIEEQLKQQANAIDAIQGGSETDRNIANVTNRDVDIR
ncbi:hypothetical protein ACP8HI_10365 [Paenibacillus sp. FA6]|uniref:hypothetical protein n=1 Tax=Paenibacillus sp. FA6 TaxID=3413029 RepID=UPI003F65819D